MYNAKLRLGRPRGFPFMKDFFISYNSADRTWAEWIAWQLEEAGYTRTAPGTGLRA